jgi:uncharacterized protein YjdB
VPYLSKLVKRITMGRASAVLLGLAACSTSDQTAVAPTEPLTRRNSVSSSSVGSVSDLRVTAASDTSATLSFTEVDNGTGLPASYDVRVAAAPISWGSAASVTRGSCTTPVTGVGIGQTLNCVVYGLSALTTYDFQLVSFRGTLNLDAAFGSLSNIATATTTAKGAPAVATVSLTPGSVSGKIGQSVQFAATAKDAAGATIIGKIATFTSTNSAVISVDAAGLAKVVGSGTAAVVATIDGKSAQSSVSVAVTAPATVTDLRVVAVADTFATLAFTQVQDGTGAPANYRMRFQKGSITWRRASDINRGTCAQPIAGTAVGGVLTCTVFGLRISTKYSFQLVAFRGTLSSNASGALSNVVSGTTMATPPVVVSVASVTVSPTTTSTLVGTTTQYAAVLKDANGTVLTGRPITWNTSKPSSATVSSTGVVSALAVDTLTVSATSDGVSGAAALAVSAPAVAAPAVPAPGAVSNLSASAFTDTTATLSFTQVTDGTGAAANYLVRYQVAPISWGAATTVARGTCVTPLAVTTVGSPLSCTVRGLLPSTNYNFQVMAYRGTINVDAVFGSTSNVAAGTTAIAAVGSVTLSPATASVNVGSTVLLTATVKDVGGTVLLGRTVTWTTSNAAVATVSTGGLVTGVAAGTAAITGSSGGKSGTAAVTAVVPPPPPPPVTGGGGVTEVFRDDFESGGFSHAQNGVWWSSVVWLDVATSIAHGGTHAARFKEGASTNWSELRFDGLANLPEVYLQYYLYLPSGNESPSVGPKAKILGTWNDKFFRLWGGGAEGYNFGNTYVDSHGVAQPYGNKVGASTWGDGSGTDGDLGAEYMYSAAGATNQWNMGQGPGSITYFKLIADANRGRWLQVRIHVKEATTANNDGVIQIWIDGALVIDRRALVNGNIYGGANPPVGYTTGYLLGAATNNWPAGQYVYLDDFVITTGGFGPP